MISSSPDPAAWRIEICDHVQKFFKVSVPTGFHSIRVISTARLSTAAEVPNPLARVQLGYRANASQQRNNDSGGATQGNGTNRDSVKEGDEMRDDDMDDGVRSTKRDSAIDLSVFDFELAKLGVSSVANTTGPALEKRAGFDADLDLRTSVTSFD
jgi:hypothetical protein